MSCDSVNGTGGKKMGWVPPSKDCCNPHRLSRSQRIVLGIFCIGTLVSLCFGILIAFAIMYNSLSLISQLTRDSYTGDPDVTGAIFDKIDQESLEEYVQWIARDPHTAGQRRDTEIAIWIRDLFRKFNLDHISESQYQVLLSYPDPNLNNVVELLDASGNPLPGVTTRTNPGIRSSKVARNIPGFGLTVQDGLLYPYHAYSPSGEVEDSLVYVNYAREADFLKLRELNVQVQGRIVIARDGMIYRGDKVANAQEFGAKGLILYPDPEDVAMSGTRDVFPGSWWLPGNGVQYGSVLKGTGDPLTPGWPAINNAHRLTIRGLTHLPKIPSQPISYDLAAKILSTLGGREPPAGWSGRLAGVSYRLGGDFTPESQAQRMRLITSNRLGDVPVTNVIGVIRGAVEPDRYVIVGSHRDAWGYGAVDSGTNTAALVKMAEAFAHAVRKEGWRPRRTLVFASWAAEEFGLIGSQEWVEQNLPKLTGRAVAYLNSDMCVFGPDLVASASDPLKALIIEAMKSVPDPVDPTQSYFEYWSNAGGTGNGGYTGRPGTSFPGTASLPTIQDINSGSDHGPFAFSAGIPSANIRFQDRRYNLTSFPTHHTIFDNFQLYKQLLDPGFKILGTCAKVMAHIARQVSDSPILPHDVIGAGARMQRAIQELRYQGKIDNSLAQTQNITLDYLEDAIRGFVEAAQNWTERAGATDLGNPMAVRMLNDQIMEMDRIFINKFENGTRHAIFSPSQFDLYGTGVFPGITDLMHQMESLTIDQRALRYEMLRRHLSDLLIMVNQAASHLREFHAV